jgi:hypothetical protein
MRKIFLLSLIMLSLGCGKESTTNEIQIFSGDPNDKRWFTPSNNDILEFEDGFKAYLNKRTAENSTIYDTELGKKVPLQDRLKYYKKRVFGKIMPNNDKILTVEYVSVRCGGGKKWRELLYTADEDKDCWWFVQYNLTGKYVVNFEGP